ncbi:MAG: efflux RND transporter periplasmic adaptor subunit [Bacteroidota bacterium]|nr:efflux RND transporter periplasmic adaptor subunit [Bacteroidota bacterium]
MAKQSRNLIRITITVILLFVIAGIIFYPKIKAIFKSKSEQGSTGISPRGQQPLFASGYILVPTEMDEMIYSTASLLPDEEVDLSFETQGKVVGIFFKEGTRVKKGELLAKINDKPLQAQLLKLRSQIKLVEEREFRQRQLLDRDAISRESYDQVVTELETLKADVMLVEARIAETELRAPFNGTVGLRMISEGAYASTQTKIVKLIKFSPLKIEFSIPERYADEIVPGFPITFEIDGFREKFQARVYAIEPKVNMNTRTIVARALYANSKEELKPGRFASVRARLSQIENAISIPTQALIPEMSGEKVFILRNGRAKEVKVTTGLRTESHIQIRTGLEFGDTLLTTATLQLRDDLPVQLDTLVTNQHLVNKL